MEFKERLKNLRTSFGLTQTKLAEKLNYGCSAISNYESGRNQPSIEDLKKLASFFNVSMDYLLGISDIKNPYNDKFLSFDFDIFKEKMILLNPSELSELELFLDYLIYRSERLQSKTLLSVAETKTPYKS